MSAELGLNVNGGNRSTIRAHALRLDLSVDHLDAPPAPVPNGTLPFRSKAEPKYLRSSAALLAASWFAQRGHGVSWPLEPAVYDLVAESTDGLKRIQVKTTTYAFQGSWCCGLGRVQYSSTAAARGEKVLYDPSDFDYFFVVDGDLNYYLLPMKEVAGKRHVNLRKYEAFKLDKG